MSDKASEGLQGNGLGAVGPLALVGSRIWRSLRSLAFLGGG